MTIYRFPLTKVFEILHSRWSISFATLFMISACESPLESASKRCQEMMNSLEYAVAFESCGEAANTGDVGSTRLLADLHFYGRGIDINLDRAHQLYTTAAQNGDTVAMFALGEMSHYGLSVARDLSAGISWYENAMRAGDDNATLRLAYMYEGGLGIERDSERADELREEAVPRLLDLANDGDARAQFSLAYMYQESREPCCEDQIKGFHFAQMAAGNGDADGQNQYATALLTSNAIENDYPKGHAWLKKSIDQGNQHAIASLAMAYLTGTGVEEDGAEALRLANSIARYRTMLGNFVLGECYASGLCGVEVDPDKSLDHLRNAAELGSTMAMNRIGLIYMYGEFGAVNDAEAFTWFKKAADLEDTWGQFEVGRYYLDGIGVAQDIERGMDYVRESARRDWSDAQYLIGYAYYTGEYIDEDKEKAAHWYQRAANQGDSEAQFMIAYMYGQGEGVRRDIAYSYAWFDVAAEQGHEKAAEILEQLTPTMFQSSLLHAQRLKESYKKGRGMIDNP